MKTLQLLIFLSTSMVAQITAQPYYFFSKVHDIDSSADLGVMIMNRDDTGFNAWATALPPKQYAHRQLHWLTFLPNGSLKSKTIYSPDTSITYDIYFGGGKAFAQ